jgi:hypothetical protein
VIALITNPYMAVPEALALIGLTALAVKVHFAQETLANLTQEDSDATPTDNA